jgi:hypothetical protein
VNLQRRGFILVAALAAATLAVGQTVAPAAERADNGPQNAASVPDFSGVWAHPFLGFEQPLSGPGPVRNKARLRTGQGDFGILVGDYTNPILKPQAAEIIKKRGEISLSGLAFPDPDSMCWPQGVPYIFWNFEMEMMQQPNQITMLYHHDHGFRQVRINGVHPAHVIPSTYGDSVGRYEGDTLVIDTVGIRVGPYAMIDRLGTPHTAALHVIERYRLIDYEAAKEAQDRAEKDMPLIRAYGVDPNYKGKGLQLQFTVEDEGVFTMPWSAMITYRRAPHTSWQEYVCAENIEAFHDGRTQYYSDKNASVPIAKKPDF